MYAESTRQGKRITVYVSGDRYMGGKVVTLNTHDIPAFDRFCSFLTEHVPNRTGGCYRRVFTPEGTEIDTLDKIEGGREYVAARHKFKRVSKDFGYRDITGLRPPRRKGFKKIDYARIIQPVLHAQDERYRQKSGQALSQNQQRHGLRLNVHENGMSEKAAHPVLIPPKKRHNLVDVIQQIETELGIPPIRKIYRVHNEGCSPENFQLVTDIKDLEQEAYYLVITGKGYDLKLDVREYPRNGKKNLSVETSPRNGQHWNYAPFGRVDRHYRHNKSLHKYKTPLGSIPSSKQSNTTSPFSNPPDSQGGRNRNRSKGGQRRGEIDYDKDEGGVYRAKKTNNARGAPQEEIHPKEKTTPIPPGTELNKRPSKETKQNADNGSQTKNKNEERVDEDAGQQVNEH